MIARPLLRARMIPFTAGSGVLTPGTISTVSDTTKYLAWPQVATGDDLIMAYIDANNHNADNSGKVVGRIGNADASVWDAQFDIADETLGAINVSLCTLPSGRIVAAYNLFNAPNTPADSVRVRYSDNNGATWSAAYTVDTSFTLTVTNSSARMIRLADGTLMMSVYGLNTGETFYSAVALFSTDDGETWGGEVLIADGEADSRQYYEPSLTALDNGDVICLIRTSAGSGDIRQSRSTDDGATWVDEGVAFGGYSPPNAIQLRSRTLVATVRGNAAAKLEVFTSINRAVSWVSQGIFDNTSYTELEYACPVQLASGDGLIVYSVQPSAAITNADIKQVYFTEAA